MDDDGTLEMLASGGGRRVAGETGEKVPSVDGSD